MSETVTINSRRFISTDCITCGVEYFVPERVWEEQRKNGGFHHCINGHSQGWGKGQTEIDKLRQERDRLRQREAQKDDEIARQKRLRDMERRTASAYKGQVTKLRKRAKHGVCPCCNRTFQNLARHMDAKHPSFEPDEPLKVIEGGLAG